MDQYFIYFFTRPIFHYHTTFPFICLSVGRDSLWKFEIL
jgi:hypothetical protein